MNAALIRELQAKGAGRRPAAVRVAKVAEQPQPQQPVVGHTAFTPMLQQRKAGLFSGAPAPQQGDLATRVAALEASNLELRRLLNKLAKIALATAEGVDELNRVLGLLDAPDGAALPTGVDVAATTAPQQQQVKTAGGNAINVGHLDAKSRELFMGGGEDDVDG